jgi:hypothetical protein
MPSRIWKGHDLEGVVAKRRGGAYLPDSEPDWLKIRNRNYSQWIGREELFEREHEANPNSDAGLWNGLCARLRRRGVRFSVTDFGSKIVPFVRAEESCSR